MGIMDYIDGYVNKVELCIPIFVDEIFDYVQARIPTLKKDIFNVYIARYTKAHTDFVRFAKGIYYRTVVTPFGVAKLKHMELVRKMYIGDGTNIYGYETGPSYMNKIGLTTQMPMAIYLATVKPKNIYIEDDNGIILVKPETTITKSNYRYLQFLDILDNKQKVHIEADNYLNILRNQIETYQLDFEKLMAYAKHYNSIQVYRGLADLARV